MNQITAFGGCGDYKKPLWAGGLKCLAPGPGTPRRFESPPKDGTFQGTHHSPCSSRDAPMNLSTAFVLSAAMILAQAKGPDAASPTSRPLRNPSPRRSATCRPMNSRTAKRLRNFSGEPGRRRFPRWKRRPPGTISRPGSGPRAFWTRSATASRRKPLPTSRSCWKRSARGI